MEGTPNNTTTTVEQPNSLNNVSQELASSPLFQSLSSSDKEIRARRAGAAITNISDAYLAEYQKLSAEFRAKRNEITNKFDISRKNQLDLTIEFDAPSTLIASSQATFSEMKDIREKIELLYILIERTMGLPFIQTNNISIPALSF